MSDAVQTPSRVYDPTPYRTTSPSVEFSAGGLLCGGRYAWLVSPGGLLRVFRSSGGECVSQLSLSPGKGRRVAVSCSCELSPGTLYADSSARDQPLLALALTVDGVRANATLVVLDPLSSRLVRAVEVPWSATSLCGVSGTALQSAAGLFSPALLREFSGVLAVGCAGGHVLLVDLALGVSSVGQGSVQRPLRLVFADGVTQRGSSAVSSARGNGEQLACVDLLGTWRGLFWTTLSSSTSFLSSLSLLSLLFFPLFISLCPLYLILLPLLSPPSLKPQERAVPLHLHQPGHHSHLPHRLPRHHVSPFRAPNPLSPHRLQHRVVPTLRREEDGRGPRKSSAKNPDPCDSFHVPGTGKRPKEQRLHLGGSWQPRTCKVYSTPLFSFLSFFFFLFSLFP